jgi:hypothetical protein
LPPPDDDILSDANGYIDGVPWWMYEDEYWKDVGYSDDDELPKPKKDSRGWQTWKKWSNSWAWRRHFRSAFTPMALAPIIVTTLARYNGLLCEMEYNEWWNQETLMQEAETMAEMFVILGTDYGKEVETITLEPAIYCMVSSKHAQFGAVVPTKGVAGMAIRLSLNPDAYIVEDAGEETINHE